MTGGLCFAVDLEQLDDTIAELTRCAAALDGLLTEVARDVDRLHGTWTGRAACAQAQAQAAWESGFREMHQALVSMRAAARTAHGSYAGAASINRRMWEQLA